MKHKGEREGCAGFFQSVPGPPIAPAKGVKMPLNVYILLENAPKDLRIITCKWLFLGTFPGRGCIKSVQQFSTSPAYVSGTHRTPAFAPPNSQLLNQ